MLKKKCPSCAKKIERKFSFCPYCGESFKDMNIQENYGFLGLDDEIMPQARNDIALPFGMDRIVESLVKQLEKQMEGMDFDEGGVLPKGVKIRISSGGNPQVRQIMKPEEHKKVSRIENFEATPAEKERRVTLPKVEAVSKVRRLADKIVYEIETPGVQTKKDVVITELASGIEVKVYSQDKCYVKVIPLKVEVAEYHIEKDRLFLELKG